MVGYGVQKKSDVTGALTQVSSKTIRERPVLECFYRLCKEKLLVYKSLQIIVRVSWGCSYSW